MRNGGGNRNAWIGLGLKATKSNPAAVGAVIRWRAGGKTYRRFRNGGGSYLSSHDPREVLGLGAADRVDWIEIRWPGGVTDRLEGLAVRRYYTVVEGSGVGAVFRRAPKRANQPALNAVPAASASLTR
jgi:enediyne biosynthesis protein E4